MIEALLRTLAPQVLATLTRRRQNFADAEDAVQEALLAAARQWPDEGIPENPRAWLTQVASRRLTDEIRRDVARRRRETLVALEAGYSIPSAEPESGEDDVLELIYLCCHPALSVPSAIALTLRAIGGLTTAEIARAFLVPEATMGQRISRAKQTIRASETPVQAPGSPERAQRLRSVLHVLYLIFNEGYLASDGDHVQRTDLETEAIRLARLVHAQLPEHAEIAGLLALMLLTHARSAARTGAHGEMIPLDQQDRKLWNRGQIDKGVALLSAALGRGEVGPYQLQAAIAAVHDEAARVEDTDWPQILALYDLLGKMSPNPMVQLNKAVAAAMVHGPRAGLDLVDRIGPLREHYRWHAVRAHLLEMARDNAMAREHYQAAARGTGNCRSATT